MMKATTKAATIIFVFIDFVLQETAQRQALPARAGFNGQSHQTLNPPLDLKPQKCG